MSIPGESAPLEAADELSDASLREVADGIVATADEAGIGLIVASVDDPGHPVLYVSEAATKVFGYSAEELVDRPLLTLIAADEQAHMSELSARARRHERAPTQFETAVLRKDGKRLPVDVSVVHTYLGGRRMAVTFVTDITEKKQSEARLSESEALFRRLIDVAPEAIWISKGDGLCFANGAALALFGFTPDEARGRSMHELLHPEDIAVYERERQLLLARSERLPPHEYRARSRDGRWLSLEVSSMAVEFEGGPAILSFGRDLTEIKEVEARVLQADRLAALGTLAGGMAHAINNPLTCVLLNLEDLSEQLPSLRARPGFTKEVVSRLEEAYEGAERVAHVVRHMRTFARSEDSVAAPVCVRSVLEAALELVGNEIRHRGNLVTEYEEVPPIVAPEPHLTQAFLNLLLHAARELPDLRAAMPDVLLAVRNAPGQGVMIEVSYSESSERGAVSETVFDPLSVGQSFDTGLAICHGIVTSLGGEMRRARSPSSGTVFRITLPTAELKREQAVESLRAPSLLPPPARARVLVVDDDPGVGRALGLMLEDEHDVTSLTSPREALKVLLADSSFDIVFCDLMMPDLTGVDMYQALHLNRPGYERRFVFMTGGAFMPEEARFVAHVRNDIVEKPFDMRLIRDLVRKAASGRPERA